MCTCSVRSPFQVKYPLTVMNTPLDKETLHAEFDLTGSELTYTSGDALGIYPSTTLLKWMPCSVHYTVGKTVKYLFHQSAILPGKSMGNTSLVSCIDAFSILQLIWNFEQHIQPASKAFLPFLCKRTFADQTTMFIC